MDEVSSLAAFHLFGVRTTFWSGIGEDHAKTWQIINYLVRFLPTQLKIGGAWQPVLRDMHLLFTCGIFDTKSPLHLIVTI